LWGTYRKSELTIVSIVSYTNKDIPVKRKELKEIVELPMEVHKDELKIKALFGDKTERKEEESRRRACQKKKDIPEKEKI